MGMNQNVILGGGYANRSGNGMRETKSVGTTRTGRAPSTVDALVKAIYSDKENTSGVDCSIAEGSRRVAQLYAGRNNNASADWMPDSSGEAYLTGNVHQQAVDDVKMAQAEAEIVQEEETEQLEEAVGTDTVSDSKLQYLERLLESMKNARKANSSKKNTSKRALNYNHSRVSGSIMRAKSTMQANNALTAAKSTLSSLRRKSSSGLYDSSELRIAINHANKMIRAAKKKIQNLKAEEYRKKVDNDVENTAQSKQNNVKRRQHSVKARAASAKMDREMLRLKKMLRQNRKQRENAHRRDENQDLLMADMEYLKYKIGLMRQQQEAKEEQAAEVREAISSGSTEGAVEGTTTGTTEGSAGETTGTDSGGAQGTVGAETAAPTVDVAMSGFDARV